MARIRHNRIFVLVSVLLAASFVSAQKTEFVTLPRQTIEERLRLAPRKDSDRQALIKKLLLDAGCAPELLREEKVGSAANVICVLPGESEGEIVVGAHFDHINKGDGVVDNWTGASLLPSLLEALRQQPRRHTYVFVAFAQEEKGLVGSRRYVERLNYSDKMRVEAMVNMDTLGLSPTKMWLTQADKKLASALAAVAAAMKLPCTVMNVDGAGTSDSEPFKNAGIPSITIHSATPETMPILHTPKDKLSAVNLDDYYDSYRLISAYMAYLDQGS